MGSVHLADRERCQHITASCAGVRVTTAARLALIIATVKKWSLFLYDHSILHVVASYYTTRRTTSYRGGGLNSDGQYLNTSVKF